MIIGLAVVWKYSTPGDHHGRPRAGLAREAATTTPADPGTISFVPRPDWYFYFLFYLLRIFKWPESVILGTIGIPTICARAAARAAVHRLRAERRPLRRPVAIVASMLVILSMGVLTYKGATAKEALGSELVGARADLGGEAGLRRQPAGGRGREALRASRLPQLPHVPRRRRSATSARRT